MVFSRKEQGKEGQGIAARRFLPLNCSAITPTAGVILKEEVRPKDPSVLKNRGNFQQTRVYPYPLGAGSARPKSKNGRSRPRKPFISRVFCAQRGSETMVSDHGLGRGQTMGRGVDPKTVKL